MDYEIAFNVIGIFSGIIAVCWILFKTGDRIKTWNAEREIKNKLLIKHMRQRRQGKFYEPRVEYKKATGKGSNIENLDRLLDNMSEDLHRLMRGLNAETSEFEANIWTRLDNIMAGLDEAKSHIASIQIERLNWDKEVEDV